MTTLELHETIWTDTCHKIVKSQVKRVKSRYKLLEGRYWLSAEELQQILQGDNGLCGMKITNLELGFQTNCQLRKRVKQSFAFAKSRRVYGSQFYTQRTIRAKSTNQKQIKQNKKKTIRRRLKREKILVREGIDKIQSRIK